MEMFCLKNKFAEKKVCTQPMTDEAYLQDSYAINEITCHIFPYPVLAHP